MTRPPIRFINQFSPPPPAEFGKSIRLYAAIAMFRAGKLSAGAAAELAEIDRYSFAEECRKQHIPPEDLRAELQSLGRIR